MKNKNLNSFLDFGYFLNYKDQKHFIDFSGTDKNKYKDVPENDLIDMGINLWEGVISDQYNSKDHHVVPLSGGIDSRAILSTLLKFSSAKNIHTYTYGTPGSLDYEIGNEIAKKCGTTHHKFPLTSYKYDIDSLINTSKRINHQTLLFLHGPVDLIDKEFLNFHIWSGTIIDVFFGRHEHKEKADNWNDAIHNSFKENQFSNSMKISNCNYDDYVDLVDYDKDYENLFELEHIIDLMNRQVKFIEPHVLMGGLSYKTLFNNKLSDFANSIPNNFRKDQSLYIKMFTRAYPELFSIRTKTSFGLSLQSSNFKRTIKRSIDKLIGLSKKRNINYIDFNDKIKTDQNLRRIFIDNIHDLSQRKIIEWIDVISILNTHLNGKKDYSDVLMVLVSLEIHLKSGLEL
jgi:hypothetical protein